jgi:hypothetical protein
MKNPLALPPGPSADLVLQETGFIEYNGKHVKQPRRNIRAAPLKTFEGL